MILRLLMVKLFTFWTGFFLILKRNNEKEVE